MSVAEKNQKLMNIALQFPKEHAIWELLNNDQVRRARRDKGLMREYKRTVLCLGAGALVADIPLGVGGTLTSTVPTVTSVVWYGFLLECPVYAMLLFALLVVCMIVCGLCLAISTHKRELRASVVEVDRRNYRELLASGEIADISESSIPETSSDEEGVSMPVRRILIDAQHRALNRECILLSVIYQDMEGTGYLEIPNDLLYSFPGLPEGFDESWNCQRYYDAEICGDSSDAD